MLEILGYIALALALAAALVVVYASTKPDRFTTARSVKIAAPPGEIFPLINDLKAFATWSPFENKDPNMSRVFSGPASGAGQRYDWKGNSEIGEGWLEILNSAEPSRVEMGLNMLKPMKATNEVTFSLVPEAGMTTVTWAMEGTVPLLAKVIHLFIDMERMCGGEFETGLANLKSAAESSVATLARG
ncbi:SRPBCC family protein [Hyphomicrobium sp.]|uniref:SRPBCC family protein n=1 Tax=Hyphomicrobium sp. TaxID=82 RepID=UPI003F6F5706